MFVKTFLTFFFVLTSCISSQPGAGVSPQEKKEPSVRPTYETLALEKFKDPVDYIFNESKTYVLCLTSTKPDASNPRRTISFFIYDVIHDSLIYEESVADGSVKWNNPYQVEIITKIGVITPTHESGQIRTLYDVRLQKKISGDTQERKDQ